jgi:hypothetical protein
MGSTGRYDFRRYGDYCDRHVALQKALPLEALARINCTCDESIVE